MFNRALKGSALLTVGRISTYGLSFLRNVILARGLSQEVYGLSTSFALAVTIFEISGRMSFGQRMIQSPEGGSVRFQALSQGLQFQTGLLGGLLLLLFSSFLASLFGVPHLAHAFTFLAFVPILDGLIHFDLFRLQREYKYTRLAAIDVIPQAVSTAMAWPLTQIFPDFRCILVLVVSKAFLFTALSHFLSLRSYALSFSYSFVRESSSFAVPLFLNGLLMFMAQQADQLVIASILGLTDLGVYSLALSIVSIPWFVFSQVGSSIALPYLSQRVGDLTQFRNGYSVVSSAVLFLGSSCIVPLILFSSEFVTTVYGQKYIDAVPICSLLGLSVFLRVLRFGPALAGIAKGRTSDQLYSNTVRLVSLPLSILLLLRGFSLYGVAVASVLAELLAVGFAFGRLHYHNDVHFRCTLPSVVFGASLAALSVTLALLSKSIAPRIFVLLLSIPATYLFCSSTSPQFATYSQRAFNSILRRVI